MREIPLLPRLPAGPQLIDKLMRQAGRFGQPIASARSQDDAYRAFQVDLVADGNIHRLDAVARIGRLRLSGFIAWVAWLLLHIFYLIDFRNRIVVLIDWAWSYFTYQRGSRLITGHRREAGAPVSVRDPATIPRSSPAPSKSLNP